jgi:hypothetical protein
VRIRSIDAGEIPVGWIRWTHVGLVSVDHSGGKNPSLPLANKTTSRNARHLLDALTSGHSVSVALVDDHITTPDGQMKMIDLADKTLRDGLEKKLIVWLCTTGAEVLNRDFNPSWAGGAEKHGHRMTLNRCPPTRLSTGNICRLHRSS